MSVLKTPRKGAKSAPSSHPAPMPATPQGGTKSAPSSAPGVAHTKPPLKSGDPTRPQIATPKIIDQLPPVKGRRDRNIDRRV